MSQICVFGWQNQVLIGMLSADAQVAALPVGNLQNDQGAASMAWRTPGTSGTLTLTMPAPVAFQAFSLHRSNLSPAASWYITASSGGSTVYSYGAYGSNQPCNIVAGQCLNVAPAPVLADTIVISFYDPNNPDGFLSLPLIYAGPLFQSVRNMSWQGSTGVDSGVDEVTSSSGVEYPQYRWSRRVVSVDYQSLGAAELPTLQAMATVALQGRNILFVPDYSAATATADMIYGRMTPGDITNPAGAADRRATKLQLNERL